MADLTLMLPMWPFHEFHIGDIVWAKKFQKPRFPCKVLTISANKIFVVRFYGDDKVTCIRGRKHIKKFHHMEPADISSKSLTYKQVIMRAYIQANEEYQQNVCILIHTNMLHNLHKRNSCYRYRRPNTNIHFNFINIFL